MPDTDTPADESDINRRTYLAALSTTAAAGLAGCGGLTGDGGDGDGDGSGDGDGDGDGSGDGDGGDTPTDTVELGERVSSINMISFSGLPGADSVEQTSGYAAGVLTDELGLPTEVTVKEFLTFFADLFNNKRTQNLHMNLAPPFLRFLDPHPIMIGYIVTTAGANGRGSDTMYANCDYSMLAVEQVRTGDRDKRQEIITEALSIASNDVEQINLFSGNSQSAWRTDQVEVPDPGNVGINDRHIPFYWEAQPIGDAEDVIMNQTPGNIDAVEWWQSVYSIGWTQTVFSGLTYFDQHHDIQPHLATDWEISDEADQFTFHLREDAVFHDGEPITSEDVKWTFEWLQEHNAQVADADSWNYDTIETPDDHTVVVTMTSPNAAWFNAHVPLWGIFPKHQMVEAGAEETPLDVDIGNNEIIGSGPYKVRSFTPEEILDLEPFEDHWKTPNSNFVFQAFQDRNAARRAFMDGSINVIKNIGSSTFNRIQSEMPDTADLSNQPSITDWYFSPAMDFGPTKFREFRLAFSQALDRTLINEIFNEGQSEIALKSCLLGKNHPFYPDNPDETLLTIGTPTGDVEQAKQTLREQGWGWDDDGRLHYPAGADLEPLWPEGSEPAEFPEKWPCVDDLQEAGY